MPQSHSKRKQERKKLRQDKKQRKADHLRARQARRRDARPDADVKLKKGRAQSSERATNAEGSPDVAGRASREKQKFNKSGEHSGMRESAGRRAEKKAAAARDWPSSGEVPALAKGDAKRLKRSRRSDVAFSMEEMAEVGLLNRNEPMGSAEDDKRMMEYLEKKLGIKGDAEKRRKVEKSIAVEEMGGEDFLSFLDEIAGGEDSGNLDGSTQARSGISDFSSGEDMEVPRREQIRDSSSEVATEDSPSAGSGTDSTEGSDAEGSLESESEPEFEEAEEKAGAQSPRPNKDMGGGMSTSDSDKYPSEDAEDSDSKSAAESGRAVDDASERAKRNAYVPPALRKAVPEASATQGSFAQLLQSALNRASEGNIETLMTEIRAKLKSVGAPQVQAIRRDKTVTNIAYKSLTQESLSGAQLVAAQVAQFCAVDAQVGRGHHLLGVLNKLLLDLFQVLPQSGTTSVARSRMTVISLFFLMGVLSEAFFTAMCCFLLDQSAKAGCFATKYIAEDLVALGLRLTSAIAKPPQAAFRRLENRIQQLISEFRGETADEARHTGAVKAEVGKGMTAEKQAPVPLPKEIDFLSVDLKAIANRKHSKTPLAAKLVALKKVLQDLSPEYIDPPNPYENLEKLFHGQTPSSEEWGLVSLRGAIKEDENVRELETEKTKEIARRLRLSTPLQRETLTVLLSGATIEDCILALLKGPCQNRRSRFVSVVSVVLHCAMSETKGGAYNPFYEQLLLGGCHHVDQKIAAWFRRAVRQAFHVLLTTLATKKGSEETLANVDRLVKHQLPVLERILHSLTAADALASPDQLRKKLEALKE